MWTPVALTVPLASLCRKSVGWAKRSVPTPSFSKAPGQLASVPRPIARQDTLRNIAMETAEWPVSNARHQPVFHGIVMNVIDVPLVIRVVADRVLPIAALPDSFFTLRYFARGTGFRSRKAA